jgi:predicted O-methyltransferase YrrM
MERSRLLKFEHLNKFTTTEGHWSTTDCIDIVKDIVSITKAESILEIGFNIGYSAAVWLENGIKKIAIIDINNHKDTVDAIYATIDTYTDKEITWWLGDSMSEEAFLVDIDLVDMAFIDGEHSYTAALNDSYLSIVHGAKWLVYDDVIENHQNGISEVINRLESVGLITIIKKYPMTWIGAGEVVLVKVNIC